MENYDVIIVGGGPAGLKCAEVLGTAKKRVLLLEKKAVFGETSPETFDIEPITAVVYVKIVVCRLFRPD